MNKEINRLSVLVEDFDCTFLPDEEVLREYKEVGVLSCYMCQLRCVTM